MRGAIGIIGAALSLLVIADLVSAMLVPRGGFAPIARSTGSLVFRCYRLGLHVTSDFRRQDRILATAAPVALLAQLIAYIVILILTMGMVVYGLSPVDGTTALFQSGSTLTTLGIVAPITGASAVACFVAAFIGLVAVAIFIGYLMALYAAYTARESLVARWSLAAGEPAWAPVVFARGHMLGIPPSQVLDADRWTAWACDLRTNISVSPVLASFRSPSPLRHWSTTLLSVLDTAALRLACDVEGTRGGDVSLIAEGIVAAHVIGGRHGDANLSIEEAILTALVTATATQAHGITDADWEPCATALRTAGLVTDANETMVRARFAAVRSQYEADITALAKTFHAVPAPWSGQRSPNLAIITPHMPMTPAPERA